MVWVDIHDRSPINSSVYVLKGYCNDNDELNVFGYYDIARRKWYTKKYKFSPGTKITHWLEYS